MPKHAIYTKFQYPFSLIPTNLVLKYVKIAEGWTGMKLHAF